MRRPQPPPLRRRDVLAAAAAVGAALAAAPRFAAAQAAPAADRLKIATIGAGREGAALGTLFVKAGHAVMFSSRHPEQLKELAAGLGPLASAGTVPQALAFGQVVLLIVPYTAIPELGREHAAELAKKQLVIDVSNPIARRDGEDFVKRVNDEGGAGLFARKALPGAPIVRAFNAIGAGQLAGLAHRQGEPAGVPIAGDDAKALALASRLTREIGFEPVVIGGLAMGRYLVPGTPLAGVHTPAEIKQIAAGLK